MRIRRVTLAAALALMSVLAVLVLAQRIGRAARPATHEIELAGGKVLAGELLVVDPGSYVVQTATDCLLLSADEIRSVDGARAASGRAGAQPVVFVQETYEEIGPAGEVEVRSVMRVRNTTGALISQVDWGIASHEIPELRDYRVLDSFGNELPLTVSEDPAIHGRRVLVRLRRPVLPGEESRLAIVTRTFDNVSREGEEWVYRHAGNYPDNRLVTRCVTMPAGAEIVDVKPEPVHAVTTGARQTIIWRRYFRQAESIPWEIRYRLPGSPRANE